MPVLPGMPVTICRHLAALDLRVDPAHLVGIGRDGGIHEDALEDVIEIPVVARKMLVVPDDACPFARQLRAWSSRRARRGPRCREGRSSEGVGTDVPQ